MKATCLKMKKKKKKALHKRMWKQLERVLCITLRPTSGAFFKLKGLWSHHRPVYVMGLEASSLTREHSLRGFGEKSLVKTASAF